uniref:hypothetical protein n=1 Tax=Escherichia coli TaxID=562 RepID=UPI001370277E
KLPFALLDHRRHALKELRPGVHEITAPVNFRNGDEITVEGEIAGPAVSKLLDIASGKTVGQLKNDLSEAAAKAAIAKKEKK